jgi:peptidoglycan/xylan/chitin deacetylase (PgdA/CDA1 family)
MKIISSWDDGSPLDLVIADALKEKNIDGIFYIPNSNGGIPVLKDNEIKHLYEMGFKIGGHTVSHPNDLKELNNEKLKYEFVTNKHWLEDIIQDDVDSFAYPKGRYNDRVIEQLKLAGYKNARTVDVMNIKECEDKFRTTTSIHIYDKRPEYKGRKWLEVAEELIIKAKEENGTFHFWGHSDEVMKRGLFHEFLELLEIIKKYD